VKIDAQKYVKNCIKLGNNFPFFARGNERGEIFNNDADRRFNVNSFSARAYFTFHLHINSSKIS
jgi:hypothetical protein